MGSLLIITSVESLQKEIISSIKDANGKYGVYISLNRPQKNAEETLKKARIDARKLFFVDCVSSLQEEGDVLHVKPKELDKLSCAITSYIREIPGEKYLLIDALSTLLIYNDENKVAQFVKEVTEFSSEKGVNVIAFSPKTRGEDLLNKIYNFFDEVRGNK
ncbi:MAG: hypothetical protein V1835_00515 [Candidatus Micrarchaeota archaeon]